MNLNLAIELARTLMNDHGLSNWTVRLDKAKSRLGYCQSNTQTIGLSRFLTEVAPESQVRNTILHEIAHALTPGHHHDETWRFKAISIGCTGDRCTTVVNPIARRYSVQCTHCNAIVGSYHRAPRLARFATKWHKKCGRIAMGKIAIIDTQKVLTNV